MNKTELDEQSLVNFINHDLMLGRSLEETITTETDLIDAKVIDSLSLIQLVTHIERETNISIDDEDVNPDNFQNVKAIIALTKRKKAETV